MFQFDLIFKIYLLGCICLFPLGMSVWGCKESQSKCTIYHLPYRWCKDLLNNGDSFVIPSHTQGNPYCFLWRNRCVNNKNAFWWWWWNQKIGCFFERTDSLMFFYWQNVGRMENYDLWSQPTWSSSPNQFLIQTYNVLLITPSFLLDVLLRARPMSFWSALA